MAVNGNSFSKLDKEEEGPKKIALFNYQNGTTLHDTLHAKADRVNITKQQKSYQKLCEDFTYLIH